MQMRRFFLVLSLVVFSPIGAALAQTNGIVTDCSSDKELKVEVAAVTNRGTITFKCASTPAIRVNGEIFLSDVSITIDGSNTGGEAITLDGSDANRFFNLSNGARLTLTDMTLQDGNGDPNAGEFSNESSGGAVLAVGADVTLNRVALIGNSGRNGSAIRVDGGNLNLYNSLVANNEGRGNGPSSVALFNATGTVVNSTVANNIALDSTFTTGVLVGSFSTPSNITLANSILYGNENDDCRVGGSQGSVTFSPNPSNIIGNDNNCGTLGVDYIANDPQFGELRGNPPHLPIGAKSPAANNGDAASAIAAGIGTADITGNARTQGTTIDLGAYEALPTDITGDGLVTPIDAIYVINRINPGTDLSADVDNSGSVTQADANAVIAAIGAPED